jgi:hypothetical protein
LIYAPRMSATLRPVPATVLPNGTVRLLENIRLPFPTMAMVTLLIEDDTPTVPETALLSQNALKDWNRDEEETAWAHLQEAK